MIKITFRCEDGSTYSAEFRPDHIVRLVSGDTLDWGDLEPGDEIESHHSLETGGTGHIVIG